MSVMNIDRPVSLTLMVICLIVLAVGAVIDMRRNR